MGDTISPFGWILIILLAVFIIAINISLFLGLKKKPKRDSWIERLTATGKKVRDPFKDENDRMRQLSIEVEKLRKHNPTSGNDKQQISGPGVEDEN